MNGARGDLLTSHATTRPKSLYQTFVLSS